MERPSPNRFTVTIGWLVLWSGIAAAGWFLIDQSNKVSLAKIKSADTQVAARDENLRQGLFLREQDLRRVSRDAAERRLLEFDQALGSPLQSAFKDPGLSIRQALQRAAFACAPTNADVRVEVERFTEFTISLSSERNLSTNQMIQVARELVPMAKPFLFALRFTVKGTVVAELDRSDIDFIDDWSRAQADRIAMLLAPEVPAGVENDFAAIDRLKQERGLAQALAESPDLQPKLQAAQTKLNEQVRKAFDDLNAALTLSQKASSFGEVAKISDLDANQRDLTAALARAAAAKEFWNNVTNHWGGLLKAEGVSSESYDQLVNTLPLILRSDPSLTAKVFDALDARIESGRYFLKLAAERFGVWRFDMEKGQFGFTDEEYAKRFRRAQEQLTQDSHALENALRAWNESLTP